MVADLLLKFKNLSPLKGHITVDDGFDKLNRSFMVVLLCLFGAVVTVRNYVGQEIVCTGFVKFDADFAADYCWTQGLYTIKEAYDKAHDRVVFPGIIPRDIPACLEVELVGGGHVVCPDEDQILPPTEIHHLWYQWVSFYFWILALAFHIPYLMYKALGFGDFKPLLALLENPVESEEDLKKTIGKAANWLYIRFQVCYGRVSLMALIFEKHRLGFIVLLTKALYLVVTVLVFRLTALMFELGNFVTYGIDYYNDLRVTNDTDFTTAVRDKLFPKMVACEIRRWGLSGIENEHGMCVLAPNVINQYLFLLLWFALVFVISTNTLSLALALVKLPLGLTTIGYKRFLMRSFLKDDPSIQHMYENVGTSGRIILHVLGASVNPKIFDDVVHSLAFRLCENKSPASPASPAIGWRVDGGGGGGATNHGLHPADAGQLHQVQVDAVYSTPGADRNRTSAANHSIALKPLVQRDSSKHY